MKIISIIVSVNLVLFFISVYSNDFYINSFPQINGFFLKLKQSGTHTHNVNFGTFSLKANKLNILKIVNM